MGRARTGRLTLTRVVGVSVPLVLMLVGASHAQDVVPETGWSELFKEVEATLEALRPRIEELESLKRPLSTQEKEQLKAEYDKLGPQVQELRQRREEATDEE